MKTNGTVKMLVLSAVSVVLCLVMLLGATFAWFSTSVTSENNIIKTAGFDVTIKWTSTWDADLENWNSISGTAGAMFGTSGDKALKPGDTTKIVYIAIINENDYDVDANITIGDDTTTLTQNGEVYESTSPFRIYYNIVTDQVDGISGLTNSKTFSEPVKLEEELGTNGKIVISGADGDDDDENDENYVIIAVAFEFPLELDTNNKPKDQSGQANIESTFKILISGTQHQNS
jgi:hypothetical protein